MTDKQRTTRLTRAKVALRMLPLLALLCAGCGSRIEPLIATPLMTPAPGAYANAQMVSITDATANSTIYFTTDGTTPTTSSTPYAGAISVSRNQTIKAIAAVPGHYYNSEVATAAYTIGTTPAATPVINPAGGSFASAQTVTITDATPGATIYFTTNGTTPTASSTPYTGAISVPATETVQAIAIATGYSASAVATATFTINAQLIAATPVINPAGGSFSSTQSVTITDATSGATIYYTTNGTAPTTSSTPYTGAISVSANETIQAIAVAGGYTNSAVATATFTIAASVAATPSITPPGGTFTSTQSVTITDTTPGATIYYTTNGTTPTTASTPYSGAISVSATETVKAIAVATGFTNSAVATAIFTIGSSAAATPVITPAGGTFTSTQSVTISDTTPGAAIYYTTNGTTPTTSSTPYTGAISVSASETILAIAAATGFTNSAVATAAFTISSTPAATPVINPAGGSFSSTQSVTITDTTPGATIYYTTNGTTPTASSTPYTGAISVSATETIQAIAVATGFSNSAVATAAFTIASTPAATPVINPAGGSFSSTQSVTITDTTPGATIYYTTNGTTPTASSTPYTGAISVSSTETIQAIAVATGFTNSAVATAAFTIALSPAATPVITPPGGTFSTAQSVTITDTTPGATIYFTNNGTTPTTSSTPYTGPITVSASETIEAIAVASGFTNSAVASATFTITPVVSGTGKWTWMGGSNTVNAAGVYGTVGVAAAGNIPGARSDASHWTDKNGNFWMFGGQNYNVNVGTPAAVYFNDLWEFNTATSQWTWMSGSSTTDTNGVYGTVGVFSAGSSPGSRIAASTWTDSSGNLWLFGGIGFDSVGNGGFLNDLWKFDPTRPGWIWMGGSNMVGAAAVYGTKGTPSTANIPGARGGGTAWIDQSGNVWLFGGQTTFFPYQVANDLWRYNAATNQWTWVSGSNTLDALGVYGTAGTPSPSNVPGARFTDASWIDSGGNLWFFGGYGFAASGFTYFLNDMWQFSPSTSNWTWFTGSTGIGAFGTYGTLGTAAPANTPGSREWHAAFTGTTGKFWLFGGQGKDSSSANYGLLNDLWSFDPTTKQWTWINGSNLINGAAVYGTLGTPAGANVPGARLSPATWVDSNGYLWVFGGYGIDSNGTTNDLNDLWRYEP